MTNGYLIVVTGDKGGVGKSTFVAIFAEWFKHQGKSVKIIDTDPTQTTQTWVDKCSKLNYEVSDPKATITIVDTAGTSGASNTKYIKDANLIVVPFQPHVADLETVVSWFLMLREDMAKRVAFVPNRIENTKEQREGISQLEDVLKEEGNGTLLNGFVNRPAIYPPLLNGGSENLFERLSNPKVLAEIETVMQDIERIIGGSYAA